LKARIDGDYGHLNNDQSAQLLRALDKQRLCGVVALHLSNENNHPDKVRFRLSTALQGAEILQTVADQEHGFDWVGI